jgi:hypothetical protein
MSILREILHNFLLNVFFIGGGFWIAEECALAAGAPPVPGDLAGIAVGAVASVLAYRSVHEPLLRHITGRPHMTPEDYRHLRELETELGWEPSGPPAPEAELPAGSPQAACDCGKCGEYARHFGYPCEQVIASQGIPPAQVPERMTDSEFKDATEAAVHFAQLARVGREFCVSYCPICSHRIHEIASGTGRWPYLDHDRRWLETERWGGSEP